MAENERITPEKQLLKLIENPKQESITAESNKRAGKKWLSPEVFKGKFLFWKSLAFGRWFSIKKLTKSPVGVRRVNTVLKIVLAGFGLYFAFSLVKMFMELKKASNLMLEAEKPAADAEVHEVELKSLSYYQEKVGVRNIFNANEVTGSNKKKADELADVPDRTKDFSLVGIAWSANPEAMIEDKAKKKTYFVRRGQSIDSSVKVVTIFKDRVILSLEGEEFQLK